MTMIEMLVALSIFSIIMAVFYTSFSSTNQSVNDLAVKQEMTQKGQRVLDYVSEQLRLAGLFISATPSIQFCSTTNTVNSLMLNPTNSAMLTYTTPETEAIAYLTSERITTNAPSIPYLQTFLSANSGVNQMTANAASSTVTPAYLYPDGGVTTANARAFITLDTLQPNLGTLVYEITNYSGSTLTLKSPLTQNVNQYSNFYSVVLKEISVDASRNLILTRWDNGNAPYTLCSAYSIPLIASHGPNNALGGVDGFVLEFVLSSSGSITQQATLAADGSDIAKVKEVSIWLLLRSDFPANTGFVNKSIYTLGKTNPITVGPFNDNYRRLLVNKSVEVKNVGY